MKFIDHEMSIRPLGHAPATMCFGFYEVFCVTCDKVVHERTTAPERRVADHLARCLDCDVVARRCAYGLNGCGCKT